MGAAASLCFGRPPLAPLSRPAADTSTRRHTIVGDIDKSPAPRATPAPPAVGAGAVFREDRTLRGAKSPAAPEDTGNAVGSGEIMWEDRTDPPSPLALFARDFPLPLLDADYGLPRVSE